MLFALRTAWSLTEGKIVGVNPVGKMSSGPLDADVAEHFLSVQKSSLQPG